MSLGTCALLWLATTASLVAGCASSEPLAAPKPTGGSGSSADPDRGALAVLPALTASFGPGALCDAEGWCWINPLPSGASWMSAAAAAPAAGGGGGPSIWIAGNDHWLLHSNGGSWSAAAAPLATTEAMWAAGPADVWMGGISTSGTAALVHLDGGGVAGPLVELGPGAIQDIWGRSANDVYAVGYLTAQHWDGSAWTPIAGVAGTSVIGDAAGDVFVGASDGMWRLSAGSWRRVPELVGEYIIGVAAAPGGRAWAAALHDGVTDVLQFDGGCWNVMTRLDANAEINVDAIGAASDTDVWVVGTHWVSTAQRGYLLHFDGTSWQPVADAPTALNRVVPVSGWGLLAVGRGGGIVKLVAGTAAGAESGWTDLRAGSSASLRGVWGSGPGDVWAVGAAGTILHFDGALVSATAAPIAVDLEDASGSGARDVWAVGRFGNAFHFDGVAWTAVATEASADLHAVFVAAPNDVWAAGDGGTVLHGDGAHFVAAVPPGADATLQVFDHHGTAADDVWLTGGSAAGPVVAHFDGAAWSPLRVLAGNNAGAPGTRVWAIARNDVWVLTRYAVAGAFDTWHFDGSSWTERIGAPTADTWMFPRPGQWASFVSSPTDRWWVGDLGAIEHQGP